ncbi:zinc-ribbon domain-containing protein [Methanobrevibacter sp.]|uniref:zinc ribbon domain-containing protein n=1 Tax=Methanobrevibacter sp. TaxID=66852 RepID=UPI00388D727A
MTIEETHNHFCIYCGAKLGEGQNFCSQCGKAVVHEEKPVVHEEKPINVPVSKYSSEIDRINREYDLKQSRATTLVNKLFDPNHMAYNKFSSSIEKSNELFHNQLLIARKMVELDNDDSPVIKQEIESKINTLQTFVDKMDDLINELVIQLSSNKKDEEDINNLFNDMDDLIHSVKDY